MLSNLITLLKRFMGFPPAATEEQKAEKLVTMRQLRDCHNAAVATACDVTYEQASKALWHWNLPGLLESPIISNPLNIMRGIKKLGYNAENATLTELLNGKLPAKKTIVLVHNDESAIKGILQQHWVVFMGIDSAEKYLFHWGYSQKLTAKTRQEVVDMVTSGWPNCLLVVKSVV
jgi:hypothetical protein